MRQLFINAQSTTGHRINPEIYGHFAEHLGRCIYNGIYVRENATIPHVNGMRMDIVEALKHIKLPVLRWPGGCFADEYHWMDGIGPKENRKRMINTHWGGDVEDNAFGTHEFMEFCEQVGCKPYINGNLGSGTVREMSEWVEYLNFDGISPMAALRTANGREKPWGVQYFAVGNENWGCGGNMRPEYYADEYRRYQTYLRNYGSSRIYRVACGPNSADYHWTEVLMANAGAFMDGLSLHYYTVTGPSWSEKGSATQFTQDEYYTTLKKALFMEELIQNHSRIMDRHDPRKRVKLIVDEWGTWYDVEPGTNPGYLFQQNTMRDAIVAAVTLNIFNRHCERVAMANLAQMVNVLQAVILTEGEHMVLTPTYHVFDLYKEHQGGVLLDSYIEANTPSQNAAVPDLHVSASKNEQGEVHITLANLSAEEGFPVTLRISGKDSSAKISARLLTGSTSAHNTFAEPNAVAIKDWDICPVDNGYTFNLPACAVMAVTVQ